ncbi:MAG TPA: hypothetical protein PKL31_14790 [Fulvivirga sp.]|nr:hypothetical protein [Fulvivirga sp.]
MKNLFIPFFCFVCLIAISSCLEDEEPVIDQCAVGNWGSVERDGIAICFPEASALQYGANTSFATFKIELYTPADKSAVSLSATINVPAAGLELNKAYPMSAADFFGVEELVSGEMTILSYEPVVNGSYCGAGTFNMITKNPNSGSQTILTNGKFLSSQGISDCNPFN